MSTDDVQGRRASAWAIPAVAVLAGLGYLVAGIASGAVWFGVGGLALMTAVGIGFMVLTRVSETARALSDRRDERINAIDRDASLFAGMTILIAVLVMLMVQIGRGENASPYTELAVLGGVSYLGALVWLRFRR